MEDHIHETGLGVHYYQKDAEMLEKSGGCYGWHLPLLKNRYTGATENRIPYSSLAISILFALDLVKVEEITDEFEESEVTWFKIEFGPDDLEKAKVLAARVLPCSRNFKEPYFHLEDFGSKYIDRPNPISVVEIPLNERQFNALYEGIKELGFNWNDNPMLEIYRESLDCFSVKTEKGSFLLTRNSSGDWRPNLETKAPPKEFKSITDFFNARKKPVRFKREYPGTVEKIFGGVQFCVPLENGEKSHQYLFDKYVKPEFHWFYVEKLRQYCLEKLKDLDREIDEKDIIEVAGLLKDKESKNFSLIADIKKHLELVG